MIPVDLWPRVLPAERVVLLRSVCKIARAEMERLGELAAIVIVKMDDAQDLEMVTERLKDILKLYRVQNLVLQGFPNGFGTRYGIGDALAGRLAAVQGQCASLAHSILLGMTSGLRGQGGWREYWDNAQALLTFISEVTTSELRGQGGWLECWDNAQALFTLILLTTQIATCKWLRI